MTETINVLVGTKVVLRSGGTQDLTSPVEFQGSLVGSRVEYGYDGDKVTDTRGTKEALYRLEDGSYLVHVEEWSRWVGEPTSFYLDRVTESDLQHGGQFERLGRAVGIAGPLTLDEVLVEEPLEPF